MATSVTSESVERARRRNAFATAQLWVFIPLLVSVGAGCALIAYSYRLSASGSALNTYFSVYWLGEFVLVGPVAFAALRLRNLQRPLLGLAGLVAFLPHLIRAPARPYMHDEFGHLMQANLFMDTGNLFAANGVVPQAAHYPGFAGLVVAVHAVTGLPTYQAGMLIVALAHIVTVLGIYYLARPLAGQQCATVAALLYSVGPQFLFFDSLFAYESLGVPLAVCIVAAGVALGRSPEGPRRRLTVTIACLLAAVIVTHHLSSFMGILGLGLLALGYTVWPDKDGGRSAAYRLVILACSGAAAAVGWAIVTNAKIAAYLLVYPAHGVSSLFARLTGGSASDSSSYVTTVQGRTPLSGAMKPGYELAATFLTQVLLLVFAIVGTRHLRHRDRAIWLLCAALGAAYFLTLPFLFSAGGQNAAHRSWAFSWIGLSVVTGSGLVQSLRWVMQRRGRTLTAARMSGIATTSVLVACLLVILVGAQGAGTSTVAAFPGPYQFQSDGRGVTTELYDLGHWMAQNAMPEQVFLADEQTSTVVAGEAAMQPNAPLAATLLLPSHIPDSALREIRSTVSYVIVDDRLATDKSANDYYFWEWERVVPHPLPESNLTRLGDIPWLTVVHRTQHYTVYRVDR